MPGLVRVSDNAMIPTTLFAENTGLLFEIHPPQMRYKWRLREVDRLWRDILSAYSGNLESYYLGTLLLVPMGNGRVSVIDGQQRLTTISMLLAVLRDKCREFEALKTRADTIQKLISRVDDDGVRVGPLVVTLQEPDNHIFVDLVEQFGSTEATDSKSDLLSGAVRTLRKNVEKYLTGSDQETRLRELCIYVQRKIKLLPLQFAGEGEAYLVFDTSNTRGLGLTSSEALKARLSSVASGDPVLSNYLIECWNAAALKLETAG